MCFISMENESGTSMAMGPNVATVKPMVQTATIMASTMESILPAKSDDPKSRIGPNDKSVLDRPSPTALVPPGRYKYNTAKVQGQQGIILVPISDRGSDSSDNGLFVPFGQVNSSMAQPNNTNAGQTSVDTTASPQNFVPLQGLNRIPVPAVSSNPATPTMLVAKQQATMFPGNTLFRPIGPILSASNSIRPTSAIVPGSMVVRPTGPVIKNICAAVPNNTMAIVGKPQTGLQPTPNLSSSAISGAQLVAIPSTVQSSLQTSAVLLNLPSNNTLTETPTTTSQPVYLTHPQNLVNPGMQIKQTPFPVSQAALTKPKTKTMKFVIQKQTKTSNTFYPTSSQGNSPSSINLIPVEGNDVTPKKKFVTPGPEILSTQTDQYPTIRPKPQAIAGKLLAAAVKPTDASELLGGEQEVQTDAFEKNDSNDVPFIINSVFSLSSSDSASGGEMSVTVKDETSEKNNGCEHDGTGFVVVENLNLRGLVTVDIRKLRKLTGRQSCSKKCRENTVERFCALKRLCIKENVSVETKKLKVDSEVLTDKEQREFELFCERCGPAPRSHKLKLFRQATQGTKEFRVMPRKKKRSKASKILKSKNFLLSEGKIVAEEIRFKNPVQTAEHSFASKAVSLLSPGSKPVQGWVPIESAKRSASRVDPKRASSTISPATLDLRSSGFQKAVSSSGSKKFYLIKVEGKNILIPVEQNSLQPRAYVLGDEKNTSPSAGDTREDNLLSLAASQAAASAVATAEAYKNVSPRVKTEPPNTGYDAANIKHTGETSQPVTVNIKQEPMNRGYEDEKSVEMCSDAAVSCLPAVLTSVNEKEINSARTSAVPTLSTSNNPTTPVDSEICPNNETKRHLGSSNKGKISAKLGGETAPSGRSISSSSADRIRRLKELLRKNEEDLERIKKKRKEEAVEISSILQDDDI